MQGFHDYLDDCRLMDMDYIGDKFTWRNGVEER
jgi:hypothetical protein